MADIEVYIDENQSSCQMIFDGDPDKYMCDVRLEKRLDDFIASEMERCPVPRRWLESIENHLLKYNDSRVCILQGLRRTGKSILMVHALNSLGKGEGTCGKSAYIRCFPQDSMEKLSNTMALLYKRGYRYIFIDEATLLSGFVERAGIFPDHYAKFGMRIVLAGTDSLLFRHAKDSSLAGRARTIHTTNIMFYEHAAITGDTDIIGFLAHGGIFKDGEGDGIADDHANFDNPENADAYCLTAVAENIQHSLECDTGKDRLIHLADLYNSGYLTSAIQRVVNDINNRLNIDTIRGKFNNHIKGIVKNPALSVFRDAEKAEALRKILDSRELHEQFMQDVKIVDILADVLHESEANHPPYTITNDHRRELYTHLEHVALMSTYKLVTVSHITREPILGDETTFVPKVPYDSFREYDRYMITQPGLRYQQCEKLLELFFRLESVRNLELMPFEKEAFKLMARNVVLGRLLEDCVLFEVGQAIQRFGLKGKVEAFKYAWDTDGDNRGEFDMVIRNIEENCCAIYEIKFANEYRRDMVEHLKNGKELACLEKNYGRITDRCLLFRAAGRPQASHTGAIRSQNVCGFLDGLGQCFPTPCADSNNDDDDVDGCSPGNR